VKLADCARSPAEDLFVGPAGCVFVFAEHDPAGFCRWVAASQIPAAWPQSTSPGGAPAALTRSPVA
jgi:hypothetical protein